MSEGLVLCLRRDISHMCFWAARLPGQSRAGFLCCKETAQTNGGNPSESSCIKESSLRMTQWWCDSSRTDREWAATGDKHSSWTGPFSPTLAVTPKQHPLASHSAAQTGHTQTHTPTHRHTHTHTQSGSMGQTFCVWHTNRAVQRQLYCHFT